MARFDQTFPAEHLDSLVREASQSRALLARADGERSIFLQTSFEIRAHLGPITREAVMASVEGEGSSQWQHQVGQPIHQGREDGGPEREAVAALITEPWRFEAEERMILAVESGPRVQLTEEAINWCDRNVPEDLAVRFLTFPAPQVDIFWFLEAESPRLLIVYGPPDFLRNYGHRLLALDEILPKIAALPHLAGLSLRNEKRLRQPGLLEESEG